MVVGKVVGSDRLYRIEGLLARGAFSTVYRCTHTLTGRAYAMKVIRKTTVERYQMKEALTREVHAMEVGASSSYMVRLVDTLVSQNNYYIIMDLAEGGTLLELIRARRGAGAGGPDSWERSLCKQLLIGIATLHERNIVHRDIKPENILLNKAKTKIMISDFGFSCRAEEGIRLHRECGTLRYCAPELLQENPSYDGRKADVWAAGITIYLLLFHVHPFKCKKRDPDVLLKLITQKPLTFPPEASSEMRDFLSKMLNVDSYKRSNAKDLLHHPWMEDVSTEYFREGGAILHSNHSISNEISIENSSRLPLAEVSTDMFEALNSFSSNESVDNGFYYLNQPEEVKESFITGEILEGKGAEEDSPTTPIPSRENISLSTSFQSNPTPQKGFPTYSSFVIKKAYNEDLDCSNSKIQCRRLAVEMQEVVSFLIFCGVLIFVFLFHFLFGCVVQNFCLARKLSDVLEWCLVYMSEIIKDFQNVRHSSDGMNRRLSNDFHGGLMGSSSVELPTEGDYHPQVLDSRVSCHIAKAANIIVKTLQNLLPMHHFPFSRDVFLSIDDDFRISNATGTHRYALESTAADLLLEEGQEMSSPLVAPSNQEEKNFIALHHRFFPLDLVRKNA